MAERTNIIEDSSGATMVEAALVLPFVIGMLFVTLGLSISVCQYLKMTNAVRVAGRLGAMQSKGIDCDALVKQVVQNQLGDLYLHKNPDVKTKLETHVPVPGLNVTGLTVEVSADLDPYILPYRLIPVQFTTKSFFPLENQGACQ